MTAQHWIITSLLGGAGTVGFGLLWLRSQNSLAKVRADLLTIGNDRAQTMGSEDENAIQLASAKREIEELQALCRRQAETNCLLEEERRQAFQVALQSALQN